MFEIIKQAFKAGNATVKYPFAPLPEVPDMRGKPEHVPENCIVCAACAITCPPNAIEMSANLEVGSYTWRIDYGRCIFCGRCEEVCPTRAIELGNQFELAVMSADDLVSTATFALERCANCGEYFAPRKQVDYAKRALESAMGTVDVEYSKAVELIHWCSKCKAKRDAGVLTESLTNAHGHVIEGNPPTLYDHPHEERADAPFEQRADQAACDNDAMRVGAKTPPNVACAVQTQVGEDSSAVVAAQPVHAG